jgi:hypothetical protein
MMANFATYVDAAKVVNKRKTDSRPAAVVLVDLLLPGARTTDNAFLKTFFRSATVTIRRRSKYGDIWALGPVLDGIRSSTPVEKLSWKRQKARCAFILMVFVPLRMMAIWRLDPTTERPGKSAGVIEVMTRDKTDSKRSHSVVLIRTLPDQRLCPLRHFRLLVQGCLARGASGTLFCSDGGRPYTTNATVRNGVADVIHEQGISEDFTGIPRSMPVWSSWSHTK